MAQEEKLKLALDLTKFFVYLITIIISISFAYNSIDKRISIIESEMNHKVTTTKLMEKLDEMKNDINRKIETEIAKVRR
jgi:uncharacterized protein YoxC